jgi:tRNA dimethylallyltransferase
MHNLIVILGPTASGKTKLACHLAAQVDGEVISADSRQVYRGMDIGTGKDIAEYSLGGLEVPYHLIDIREPGYKYNIAEFQVDFYNCFTDICKRNKMPILCGGSGLYLETALAGNSYLGIPKNLELRKDLESCTERDLELKYKEIKEEVKQNLNALTRPRLIRAIEIDDFLDQHPEWKPIAQPDIHPLIIGVDIQRELRREKISKRLSERLNGGLIEEVEELLKNGLTFSDLSYYGLEYKWVGDYLQRKISKKELFQGLEIAIHQFSKRQMTWFRKMEKNGVKINWISAKKNISAQLAEILDFYNA